MRKILMASVLFACAFFYFLSAYKGVTANDSFMVFVGMVHLGVAVEYCYHTFIVSKKKISQK